MNTILSFHLNIAEFLLFQTGERGYLEGLASRYADRFSTHYGDVLEHLEDLRRKEWEETPAKAKPSNPQTPPSPGVDLHPLTSSHSQPIYVPGKYSVSRSESARIKSTPVVFFSQRMLKKIISAA